MKYKIGKLSNPVGLFPGDSIKLSYTNMAGTECLHEEVIETNKYYTHWLFMDIGNSIGDAFFMGDHRLEEWFNKQFPQAEKIDANEPLFV